MASSNNWLYYAIAGVAGYFIYEKYFSTAATATAAPVATPAAVTGPVSSALATPVVAATPAPAVAPAVAAPAPQVSISLAAPGSQPESIGYQETWYGNDASGQTSAQAAEQIHGGTWQVVSVAPNTTGPAGSNYQIVVQRIA